jgi:hypothetical protein
MRLIVNVHRVSSGVVWDKKIMVFQVLLLR